jgi:hypothetical protein
MPASVSSKSAAQLLLVIASLSSCDSVEQASPSTADAGSVTDAQPESGFDAAVEASALDASVSACPNGSREVARLRDCAPNAPPASAALQSALRTAAPGSIVSLGGLASPSVACANVVTCVPANARTLIFSDDPEDPTTDGVLYADTLRSGVRYRLFVYHANGSEAPRKFSVVALNQGNAPARVRLTSEASMGPTKDYLSASKDLAEAYLQPLAIPRDVGVAPGARVVFDPVLDARIAKKGELVSAFYDLEVDQAVKLSVVTVSPSADAASATASLPLLPYDGLHNRGTFPDADYWLVPLDLDGLRRLRLGAGTVDPNLIGTDATRGVPERLLGNFGATYTVITPPGLYGVIVARGGPWAGAASNTALPSTAKSLLVGDQGVCTGATTSAARVLLTAGSSALPIDLLLTR